MYGDLRVLVCRWQVFGPLVRWRRSCDPETGVPKRFGFAEYAQLGATLRVRAHSLHSAPLSESPRSCPWQPQALNTLNDLELMGTTLLVKADAKSKARLEEYEKELTEEQRKEMADAIPQLRAHVFQALGGDLSEKVPDSPTPLDESAGPLGEQVMREVDRFRSMHAVRDAKRKREMSRRLHAEMARLAAMPDAQPESSANGTAGATEATAAEASTAEAEAAADALLRELGVSSGAPPAPDVAARARSRSRSRSRSPSRRPDQNAAASSGNAQDSHPRPAPAPLPQRSGPVRIGLMAAARKSAALQPSSKAVEAVFSEEPVEEAVAQQPRTLVPIDYSEEERTSVQTAEQRVRYAPSHAYGGASSCSRALPVPTCSYRTWLPS